MAEKSPATFYYFFIPCSLFVPSDLHFSCRWMPCGRGGGGKVLGHGRQRQEISDRRLGKTYPTSLWDGNSGWNGSSEASNWKSLARNEIGKLCVLWIHPVHTPWSGISKTSNRNLIHYWIKHGREKIGVNILYLLREGLEVFFADLFFIELNNLHNLHKCWIRINM